MKSPGSLFQGSELLQGGLPDYSVGKGVVVLRVFGKFILYGLCFDIAIGSSRSQSSAELSTVRIFTVRLLSKGLQVWLRRLLLSYLRNRSPHNYLNAR